MIDREIEQRLQDWLRRDAAALAAPAALQQRVLDIPATVPAGRPWWTGRFSFVLAPAAAAAVLVTAVLASQLLDVLDRPAGIDGGLCNNRQVHGALEALRDAPGYRYEARDELYDADAMAEASSEDPQDAWRIGFAAEGAYRSPDRLREVVTVMDGMNRGYVEQLMVGDTAWQLIVGGRGDEWVRVPSQLPTANLVYGYLQAVFPALQVPGVTTLDWGAEPAPDDIPGTRGCTVATPIPGVGMEDIVGLRIDVGSGLPIGVYRGPPANGTPPQGAARHVFGLTWETPAEDEFAPPSGAQDAPDPPAVEGPSPSEVPAQTPAPGAWQPHELPLPDGWESGVVSGVVHLGVDGFVAVGAADRVGSNGSYASEAVVWTSPDGVTWVVVEDSPETEMLGDVAWDGETLLATGLRTGADGVQRWEIWASADGRSWSPAAAFGEGVQPGRFIATSHGWVASSIRVRAPTEAGAGPQMSTALLHSDDGTDWTESLANTGTNGISTIVERPGGTLLAYGCESQDPTDTQQFAEMCISRYWRSDDGLTWTPGPPLDVELSRVAVDGDRLVGIGRQTQPGAPATARLYRSIDGETWTEESFSFGTAGEVSELGMGGPETIAVVGVSVIVEGARTGVSPSGRPYPALWRSTPDGGWEEVPIGFTTHGGFIEGIASSTDGRLVLAGSLATSDTASQPVVWLPPTE